MFGIPLHPIVVHFPIVLSVFLPILALAFWLVGHRSANRRKYWTGMVIVHALVFGSGFLAMQSGESDEERVEKVLATEAPLEEHEHKGELFVQLSGAALLLAALGLAPGNLGLAGRGLAGLASLALILVGVQAGHTGGKLVYKHGAAAAYAADGGGAPAGAAEKGEGKSGSDEDDD